MAGSLVSLDNPAMPCGCSVSIVHPHEGDPPTRHLMVTFPSARPSEIIYGMAVKERSMRRVGHLRWDLQETTNLLLGGLWATPGDARKGR